LVRNSHHFNIKFSDVTFIHNIQLFKYIITYDMEPNTNTNPPTKPPSTHLFRVLTYHVIPFISFWVVFSHKHSTLKKFLVRKQILLVVLDLNIRFERYNLTLYHSFQCYFSLELTRKFVMESKKLRSRNIESHGYNESP